ncbi:MAG: hypothetical protein JXR53_03525 [Bacteroidales bacterium]|nr:hypothetical protein [Bacteroidales bacterium]
MKKCTLLILLVLSIIQINAQDDSSSNITEVCLAPFFQIDAGTFDTRSSYYAYEGGVYVMVYTFNKTHRPFHLHIGASYKEVGFDKADKDNWYYASYLGFGPGVSTNIELSEYFLLTISNETYLNFQVRTYSANNSELIDDGVKAIQNKLGTILFWEPLERIKFGIGGKIAPCLILSKRNHGSAAFPYSYDQLIDYGWPFYIGSTIRVKL